MFSEIEKFLTFNMLICSYVNPYTYDCFATTLLNGMHAITLQYNGATC